MSSETAPESEDPRLQRMLAVVLALAVVFLIVTVGVALALL